tara:strand:+ start:1911 stop:2762 length:852 start_codon:yes stop_codon:yes gene_type:complete
MSESETENTEPVTPTTDEEVTRARLQIALSDYVHTIVKDAQPSADVATVDLNDESFIALLAKMKQDNDDGGAVSEMIVSTIRAWVNNGNFDLDDLGVDDSISDWVSNNFDIDNHVCMYDLAERVEGNIDMDSIAQQASEHLNIHDQVGSSLTEFMQNGCGDVETAVGTGVERTLLIERGTLQERRRDGVPSVILTNDEYLRIMSVVNALHTATATTTTVEVEKVVEVGTPRILTTEEHGVEVINAIGTDETPLREFLGRVLTLKAEQDATETEITEGIEEESE